MNDLQPRPALAIAVGTSLTAFLTAGVLALLLLRLGDTVGARWAGWLTLAAAAATIIATALSCLAAYQDGTKPRSPDSV